MAGFAVTPSDILTGADEEIDLVTLVDKQDALAAEAREVLPYKSDECTYVRGPLRQSVFSCLDCGEKGVCYGCSISCHAEHRIVELWTKRAFTCDCPTETMAMSPSGPRKCALNPAPEQPYPANEDNRYSHNFSGKFCRCGRDYDPVTEPEAMVHCIGCEDWFHESCLNLQPRRTTFANEDEDEEAECLIPSETYDGLVCAKCVESHPFLLEKRGTEGWMTIVPEEKAWVVKGKLEKQPEGDNESKQEQQKAEQGANKETVDTTKGAAEPATATTSAPATDSENRVPNGEESGGKRPLAEDSAPEAKRARVEDAEDEGEPPKSQPSAPAAPLKAAGDIFISHGIRESLSKTLADDVASSLPFPLVDAEIYEPAEDTDDDETLEQVTERVVGALPRFQAIEAVHGYQAMKDKLKVMLSAHAEAGKTVSREDIEEFFESLRKGDK